MAKTISQIREEYSTRALTEEGAPSDAIEMFNAWFEEALSAGLRHPNAMTLSTATPEGIVSSRTVLLKDVEEAGFVFYTNYHSRKARELAANSAASLLFWWNELERQVRIEGRVSKVPPEVSDSYFRTRPRDSQLGAWASDQSQEIAGRKVLEEKFAQLEEKFAGKEVERPPHWGGYVLHPQVIEFWQGRPSRLHDRLRYRKDESGKWEITRLAP